MSISVISFTENGIRLSERLANTWGSQREDLSDNSQIRPCRSVGWGKPVLYTKHTMDSDQGIMHAASLVEQSVGEWAKEQMQERNALLFIGACGIAVRAIAPNLTDKLHDSPVLVMDEKGMYVIPILSGHFGGANEIAMEIARALGAIPVITTATDLNRKFAVDLFAKKNGLSIVNKDGIAKVSSKVLAGKDITISIETGHVYENCRLPAGVHMISYPPEQYVDVLITAEEKEFDAAILLRPREYVVGMGCKKEKEAEKIEDLILRSMKDMGIGAEQLFALASIDRKKDEQGILVWSRKNHVPFITYTAEQLKEVGGNFQASAFVMETVGVDNVCERAALKACGPAGKIIYGKHAEDGMTIAIAKREWSITFDEE